MMAGPRFLEPEREAQFSEFLAKLREALAELPEPQSAAFVLTQLRSCPTRPPHKRWASP